MRIDPEFQALIPPLSDDEFAALELSIMTEGCRDAIVVWQHDGDDIIVDGHNRYAICTAAGLPYKTVTRDFSSRSEVMLWMIRNQLARRNLNDGMRLKLAWQLKEKIADVAKENKSIGGGDKKSEMARSLSPTSEKAIDKVETAREIGKVAEVGKTKVYQYQYIRDNAPAELLERVHNGEITVNRAETFARELAKHPQPVIDLALRLADDSADKVAILARLYKSNGKDGSNSTFDEIATNGGFHYGDEMDDWCDFAASSARQIEDALRSLEKYHQIIEAGVKHNYRTITNGENEWYTPQAYIDMARQVMGSIDLDPASCAEANQVIRANQFYSIDDNGLNQTWRGKVWLNPPYSRDLMPLFTDKLKLSLADGLVTEAIMVSHNNTDTQWFHNLADSCAAICFPSKRIKFYRGDDLADPVNGQMFMYFGGNTSAFKAVFSSIGFVMVPA